MPDYILLSRFTGDTRKDAASLPGKLAEFEDVLGKEGITVKDQWMTLGHYQHVAVIEADAPEKIVATLGKASAVIESETDVLGGFSIADAKALLG